MTIDDARSLLLSSEPGKAYVVYRPVHAHGRCADGERGVVTRVSGTWVFVRYEGRLGAQATDPADLEPAEVQGNA